MSAKRRGKFRLIWFLVFWLFLLKANQLSFDILVQLQTKPLVSTMETEYFSTSDLHFPGVAVCTINRISHRSTMKLAREIYNANITELSLTEICNLILYIGDLYDSAIMREKDYNDINEILTKFYNGSLDITNLMEYLTPQCSDMLLKCFFHDIEKNCSEIFSVGKTQNGFCCTFNYVIKPEDMSKLTETPEPKVERVSHTGFYYGLTVVMEPHLDDYSYPIHPIYGWKVMIFSAFDYPDSSSGSVSEVLVEPSTEQFVQLKAVGMYSTDSIRLYSIQTRGCIFPDELERNYVSYTSNECIVDCKLKHIWSKCKCRPFYYPRNGFTESSNRTCTVTDIPCLTKYYKTPYKIKPYKYSTLLDDEVESNEVVRCNNCYPECDDVVYKIESIKTFVDPGYYNTSLFRDMIVKNHSILHIYFADRWTWFSKHDVYYRWFEYFSYVGGLYGLFLGYSLVSSMEALYITTLCLLEICLPSEEAKEAVDENAKRSIYWNEFPSRSRMNTEKDKNTTVQY